MMWPGGPGRNIRRWAYRGKALLSEHVAAAPFFAVLQSGRST